MKQSSSHFSFLSLTPNPLSLIAIAVSGGADSMALCLMAQEWADREGIKLVALTVDHGLRKESTKEAKQVGMWLKVHKISHHILTWKGKKPKANIQEKAREARYKLLTVYCKKHHIPVLMTAHHREDQAETVLMRLMRGSGVDGLSGIPAETVMGGITIFRPLLSVSKAELIAYLKKAKQAWTEDPSNDNTRYTRVQLRRFLAQAEDRDLLVGRLADTASHLSRVRDFLEQSVAGAEKQLLQKTKNGVVLDFTGFCGLHPEIAYRLLSRLLLQVGGKPKKPRFESLERLYAMLVSGEWKGKYEVGGCVVKESGVRSQESGKKSFLFSPKS